MNFNYEPVLLGFRLPSFLIPFPPFPASQVKLCAGSFCLILFNMRVRRVIFDSLILQFFSIFCTLKCRCQQSSIGGDKWALRTESHLHKYG